MQANSSASSDDARYFQSDSDSTVPKPVAPRSGRPSDLYGSFSVVPAALRALDGCTPHITAVFSALWELRSPTTLRVDDASRAQIAERAGVSKAMVNKAVRRLADWGFLVIERSGPGRGRGNKDSYLLLDRRINTTTPTIGEKDTVEPTQGEKDTVEPTQGEKDTVEPTQDEKRTPDDPFNPHKRTPDDPFTDLTPHIGKEIFKERVRESHTDSCEVCALAHTRIFDESAWGRLAQRVNRELAASAYLQTLFRVAHSKSEIERPWALASSLAGCYVGVEDTRFRCRLPDCPHGHTSMMRDRGERLDRHRPSRQASNPPSEGPLSELVAGLFTTDDTSLDDQDLEARRRHLLAQLAELETRNKEER